MGGSRVSNYVIRTLVLCIAGICRLLSWLHSQAFPSLYHLSPRVEREQLFPRSVSRVLGLTFKGQEPAEAHPQTGGSLRPGEVLCWWARPSRSCDPRGDQRNFQGHLRKPADWEKGLNGSPKEIQSSVTRKGSRKPQTSASKGTSLSASYIFVMTELFI